MEQPDTTRISAKTPDGTSVGAVTNGPQLSAAPNIAPGAASNAAPNAAPNVAPNVAPTKSSAVPIAPVSHGGALPGSGDLAQNAGVSQRSGAVTLSPGQQAREAAPAQG